jgi:hypothetical protein
METSGGLNSDVFLHNVSPATINKVAREFDVNMKEMSQTEDLQTYVDNIYKDPLRNSYGDVNVVSSKTSPHIQVAEVTASNINGQVGAQAVPVVDVTPTYMNDQNTLTHDALDGMTANVSGVTNLPVTRRKSLLTRKIGAYNKSYAAFPLFYKKEIKRVISLTIVCASFFLISLIGGLSLSI